MLSISWLAESDARGSPHAQTAPRMAVILSTLTERELQVRLIPSLFFSPSLSSDCCFK